MNIPLRWVALVAGLGSIRYPIFALWHGRRSAARRILLLYSLAALSSAPAGVQAAVAEPPPSSPVYFVIVVSNERYAIQLNDPAKIETVRKILAGLMPQKFMVAGKLVDGDGGYNRDVGTGRRWSWHLEPESIGFPEVTVEIFDGRPSGVESDKDYWLKNVGFFAPWTGRIESEGLVFRPGQFASQSARAWVGTEDEVQIAGFVIAGTEGKNVLIRAAGPALVPFGVSGALADPSIELHDQATGLVIASNDNWSDTPTSADNIEAAASRVGAFAWPRGSKDSALLVKLNPGAYTAIVRGQNHGTGVALVETYNVDDPTGTKLVSISTRARVKTGEDVQIAGFAIGGVQRKTVLIRAAGPALIPFGVNGTLADPMIELYDQRTGLRIGSADNWGESDGSTRYTEKLEAAARTVGAFPWPRGSKDAAMLAVLEPGIYTAAVKGIGGTTGVALMEVYEVE